MVCHRAVAVAERLINKPKIYHYRNRTMENEHQSNGKVSLCCCQCNMVRYSFPISSNQIKSPTYPWEIHPPLIAKIAGNESAI